MKIVMMTDLEGVAGVVGFTTQAYDDGKYYEQARSLLTAEVNAAVDGLLSAGVADILVVDGHGPGAVVFEELHPATKLLHGRPSAPAVVRNPIIASYDASIMIGQHAMANVAKGNMNHSQSSRAIDYIKLNGVYIGEIAQWALYCGALGLSLLLLSGDDAACIEAKQLIPEITTAQTKQGLSRNSAISLSAIASRDLIRNQVQRAIENHRKNPIAPLTWDPPYVLEKRFFHTDTADAASDQFGVERVDSRTVRLHGDDLLSIIYR